MKPLTSDPLEDESSAREERLWSNQRRLFKLGPQVRQRRPLYEVAVQQSLLIATHHGASHHRHDRPSALGSAVHAMARSVEPMGAALATSEPSDDRSVIVTIYHDSYDLAGPSTGQVAGCAGVPAVTHPAQRSEN